MAYQLMFGMYIFPPTFYIERWPTVRNMPSAKLARADGARVLVGYLEGKTFGLRGALVGNGEAIPTGALGLRDQLDQLRAACASGPTTFQAYDDRFFRNAQVSSFEERFGDTAFGRFVEISLEVVCGDPFAYETASHTGNLAVTASGQTLTLTNVGNAAALPTISVTANGAGALAATISNQTTGEACTLTGLVANGEVILINSLLKTVTAQADGTDRLLLFDGLFPRLLPGPNTLAVQYLAGGPAVVGMGAVWVNRWV